MLVVLDTNHFTEFALGSPAGQRLLERANTHQAEVFSCVVAAEESLQGWMAFIRRHPAGTGQIEGYHRLQSCLETLAKFTMLPFDREAAELFEQLRDRFRRTGAMDLKIAAICLTHEATLLTRNISDFKDIPGLLLENWLE